MAVFLVRRDDGTIASRHLRANCPRLVSVAEERGIPVLSLRVRNTARNGSGDEATRCSLCFFELGPLPRDPVDLPVWVERAQAEQYRKRPGQAFVYDIFWAEGRLSHVGSTRDPRRRFREYWRGICGGGFTATSSIFWLNHLLHDRPDFEPDWELEAHPETEVVADEHRRREWRRANGWEVATDV